MREVGQGVKTFRRSVLSFAWSADVTYLKITQTEAGLAIVLDDEARELLDAKDGSQVSLEVGEDGKVVLSGRDMSPEARRERGRAFIQRYQKTFETLAK